MSIIKLIHTSSTEGRFNESVTYNANGSITSLMWQFDGGYVELNDNGTPTCWNYYVTDHLGSTRMVVSSNDSIRETINYYPFGSEMRMEAPAQIANSLGHPFRFTGKELDKMSDLNMYDFGARWYDVAGVPVWTSVDPHCEKYYNISPYVYCSNNPVNAVDIDGRDGVYIVFPDYKISTPVGKISGLGHAGVLLIDNKSGLTKYYEYGRYDSEGKGLVRTQTIPDVEIGKDGKPTYESLQKTLSTISEKAGQGGRIEGAYIQSDNFESMNNYAKQRLEENSNDNRTPYSLIGNNCGTFAKDVLEADTDVKEKSPLIIDTRPVSIVEEYQNTFESVSYKKQINSMEQILDIVLLSLYLGFPVQFIGMIYTFFRNRKKSALSVMVRVGTHYIISIILTMVIWFNWFLDYDIMFGFILIPSFISELFLCSFMLVLKKCHGADPFFQ